MRSGVQDRGADHRDGRAARPRGRQRARSDRVHRGPEGTAASGGSGRRVGRTDRAHAGPRQGRSRPGRCRAAGPRRRSPRATGWSASGRSSKHRAATLASSTTTAGCRRRPSAIWFAPTACRLSHRARRGTGRPRLGDPRRRTRSRRGSRRSGVGIMVHGQARRSVVQRAIRSSNCTTASRRSATPRSSLAERAIAIGDHPAVDPVPVIVGEVH